MKFTPYTCHPRVNGSNGIAERSNENVLQEVNYFFLVVTCLLTHDKELFVITGRKKAYYEIVRRLNRNACTNALLVSCP